ncbi:MAG: TIR domain-containing protein [Planctomycetota bacterium]
MNHVFISYVRENEAQVQRLAAELRKADIKVWLDRDNLKPGTRWQDAIKGAIREGSFFIACFSDEYDRRDITYANEELTLAREELRKKDRSTTWFIPLLLSGDVPEIPIGPGETIRDIHWVDVTEDWESGVAQLIGVIQGSDHASAPDLAEHGSEFNVADRSGPLTESPSKPSKPWEEIRWRNVLLWTAAVVLIANLPLLWVLATREPANWLPTIGQAPGQFLYPVLFFPFGVLSLAIASSTFNTSGVDVPYRRLANRAAASVALLLAVVFSWSDTWRKEQALYELRPALSSSAVSVFLASRSDDQSTRGSALRKRSVIRSQLVDPTRQSHDESMLFLNFLEGIVSVLTGLGIMYFTLLVFGVLYLGGAIPLVARDRIRRTAVLLLVAEGFVFCWHPMYLSYLENMQEFLPVEDSLGGVYFFPVFIGVGIVILLFCVIRASKSLVAALRNVGLGLLSFLFCGALHLWLAWDPKSFDTFFGVDVIPGKLAVDFGMALWLGVMIIILAWASHSNRSAA